MFEEQKTKTNELLVEIANHLKNEEMISNSKKLKDLKDKLSDPDLYNNISKLKSLNIEIKKLESSLLPWENLFSKTQDLQILIEMSEEEKDKNQTNEIDQSIKTLDDTFNKLELLRLFRENEDFNNAYLTIHSGAGGTESCDWAMMLFRMYTKWMDSKSFKYSVIDYQQGEEAGIKSATIFVEGDYAHGFLKGESGVHRLVRISPFDSQKRRHTSFSSIYSTPEIEDDVNINILPTDIKVDTYRAGGAGGQHVNTTDSAVRITHLETNIVVTCQAERSQLQNKERAMKVLKSKLHAHYLEIKKSEIESKSITKKKIEWGSQIRSYVFHPYNMVKDHRSEYEVSNVSWVMDGDLDGFFYAYLKMQK